MMPAAALLCSNCFAAHISLSGTAIAPNTSVGVATEPTNAVAGWRFNVDGTVERFVSGSYADWDTDPEEWVGNLQNPNDEYWIRFTLDSGDAATTITGGAGVWNKISGSGEALALITWTQGSVGTLSGVYQVDIATDSGGSNIIATGYYEGTATQNSSS